MTSDERLPLTLGAPRPEGGPEGGWWAITDRGERLAVPATATASWSPRPGQRLVATLDEHGAVTRVEVPGTGLPLPRVDRA